MNSLLFSVCLFGSRPAPKITDIVKGSWNCNISKANEESKFQTLTIEKSEGEEGVLIAQLFEEDEEGTNVPAARFVLETVDAEQTQFSVAYENGDDVVKYENTYTVDRAKVLGYLDSNTTFVLRFISNDFIEISVFNVEDSSFMTIDLTRDPPPTGKGNLFQSMLPMIMMFVAMNFMNRRGGPARGAAPAEKKND